MRLILPFFAVVLFTLAGCATSYGPRGLTGGYTDTKIDDSTYRVTFSGNGKTTRNMVWNYWIYRCAELTTQNGYEFFSLQIDPKKVANAPQSNDETVQLSESLDDSDAPLSQMAHAHAPVFIYVPGNTITTYSGSGVIRMMHQPDASGGLPVLQASTITQMLSAYVNAKGRIAVPSDQEILKAAVVTAAAPAIAQGNQLPQAVTMEDLKNLLPPR
jgi:hypothetical protein